MIQRGLEFAFLNEVNIANADGSSTKFTRWTALRKWIMSTLSHLHGQEVRGDDDNQDQEPPDPKDGDEADDDQEDEEHELEPNQIAMREIATTLQDNRIVQSCTAFLQDNPPASRLQGIKQRHPRGLHQNVAPAQGEDFEDELDEDL